jgi:protein-disulfide isomerase
VAAPEALKLLGQRATDPSAAVGSAATGGGTTPTKKSPTAVAVLGVAAVLVAVGGAFAMKRGASNEAANAVVTSSAAITASAPAPPAVPSASTAPSSAERSEADLSDPTIVWKVPLGGSPQRGPENAPVTIVEFANYQCPFSKGIEAGLRQILDQHPGKVRLIWKDDPLAVHSQAEVSANVAHEARAQKGAEGYWAAHDLFLQGSFKPSVQTLLDAAKKLSLDVPRVERAMAERPYAAAIAADADLADAIAVQGTPTFFVNGRRIATTPSLDKLREAVEQELARVEPLLAQGAPAGTIYARLTDSGRSGLPLEIKSFNLNTITAPSRGPGKSSVTLLEFCDFTNYLCKLVDPLVDELMKTFPEDLDTVWIDVPDPASEASQRASLAARSAYHHGGVEGFDRMRRLLLESQKKPDAFANFALLQYADAVHLQRGDFKAGLEDPVLIGEIARAAQNAREAGLATELPAFLVCGADFCAKGGYFLSGVQPRRAFQNRVRLVLDAKGGPLPALPR